MMHLFVIDLSLAVPLTNSLTFIFVSISGRLLGEKEGKSGIQRVDFIIIFYVFSFFKDTFKFFTLAIIIIE